MRIDRATAQQVRDVALRMRDSDFREFSATSFAETREALANELTLRYAGRADVLCAETDEPVAIGALLEIRPNVLTLLFFATDKFPQLSFALTRFIRQRLIPGFKAAGAHRIECVSIDGHDAAHRWIEKSLGLPRRFPMEGYGKAGETFHQFAWISDDVRQIGA